VAEGGRSRLGFTTHDGSESTKGARFVRAHTVRGQECPRHTINTNLLNQRASIAAIWFLFGGDDYCGGYAVAGF
jgi:hypothetical protein